MNLIIVYNLLGKVAGGIGNQSDTGFPFMTCHILLQHVIGFDLVNRAVILQIKEQIRWIIRVDMDPHFLWTSSDDCRDSVGTHFFPYFLQIYILSSDQSFGAESMLDHILLRVNMDLRVHRQDFWLGKTPQFPLFNEIRDPLKKIDESLGSCVNDSSLG